MRERTQQPHDVVPSTAMTASVDGARASATAASKSASLAAGPPTPAPEPTATSCSIPHLLPGAKYAFELMAHASGGLTAQAEPGAQEMMPEAPGA